jgi:sarcosine oxidase
VTQHPGAGAAGSPDLVVVGAGTMGAWTALWANRAGLRTTLVDAWGAGHPRATSGDETRIIRSSYGSDPFYARWSRAALAHWRRFGEEWGENLFRPVGTLWLGHRPDGFEAESLRTLLAEGIPAEQVAVDEARRRWPQIAVEDDAFLVFEPEAGALMARQGTAAAASAFERDGGRFERSTARPGRAEDGRLLDVVLGDGRRLSAGSFVFAAGPWLARVFPEVLGELLRVTKQDVFFFGPAGGDTSFDAGQLPTWVDYDGAFYGVPAIDGRGTKLAPDRYGPVFDPSAGERIVDPDSTRLARAYAARRFPALATQPIVETRVCQYEMTPDAHFILDRHPALSNTWIAGGGSGHAFKHGPRIGEYLVARLQGAPLGPGEERFNLGSERVDDSSMRTGADAMVAGWQGY